MFLNSWLFRYVNCIFPVLLLIINGDTRSGNRAMAMELNVTLSNAVFTFHDVEQCKRNEFYDLNYFKCVACNLKDELLLPAVDKLSCECSLKSPTSVLVFDTISDQPLCRDSCSATTDYGDVENGQMSRSNCPQVPTFLGHVCKWKYINSSLATQMMPSMKHIYISSVNRHDGDTCSSCDLKYNFQYNNHYCISNGLLKPHLKYNAFWPSTIVNGHFGELKFVAFFCISLRNATACNHLANLCVISHYSFDKNSPCSVFLLTQASDAVLRYSTMDEQLQSVRPFLFFKRGKQTAEMLTSPLPNSDGYDLSSGERRVLKFFSVTYSLDGTPRLLGQFKANQFNFCRKDSAGETDHLQWFQSSGLTFARQHKPDECTLTLENLIDLAQSYANNNFISLFLQFTDQWRHKTFMHAVPILIEDLAVENQRHHQPEEWQLVKRFQLISLQSRHHYSSDKISTLHDSHKLQLYRSLRYVERFSIHYNIFNGNRISVPVVKLRYRNIEFDANITLDKVYNFKFEVIFTRTGEGRLQRKIQDVALPILLVFAFGVAVLRTCNSRSRRRAAMGAINTCDLTSFYSFVVHSMSSVSNALLVQFLLQVAASSITFLRQTSVEITLPIEKGNGSLRFIIFTALLLKSIAFSIRFWRISHSDLFFIDWERPKSYDNNHFNLKTNLETSSVCSSVRTFVSENNVSVWRVFFIANEWIRLCVKQKTSIMLQGFVVLILFKFIDRNNLTQHDTTLELFLLTTCYIVVHIFQLVGRFVILNQIFGNPLQKFIDLCTLANISIFALLEPSYGFYIHGRSPHGFSDTDMSSMILQLQRESQNMCGRRGLLSDSDQQTYIIMPPRNLRNYFDKLLVPFHRSCSISQAHFQKEIQSVDGNLDRNSIAYSTVNRFFCAFIDHALKDMDYIIKELTIAEDIFNCQFDNYITENKGTFYIDASFHFSRLFLYGNNFQIFLLEFAVLITIFMATKSLVASIIAVCLLNKIFEKIFRCWIRGNVSVKTLIDKRFLM